MDSCRDWRLLTAVASRFTADVVAVVVARMSMDPLSIVVVLALCTGIFS